MTEAAVALDDLTRSHADYRAAWEAEACALFVDALRRAEGVTPIVNWREQATLEWRDDLRKRRFERIWSDFDELCGEA